jgi:CRISPR-associated endoribonuclease Cas6
MLYGNYQFLCRLTHEAVLPSFKGSTLRGVFGRALRKVVCALKRQECEQCLLKEKCVYAQVFETDLATDSSGSTRFASPPHPFVIEPPLTTATHFQAGSSFDFHLLLFGDVNGNLPYFIYAFEEMGKIGIGKRSQGKRGEFTLEEVKVDNHPIYSSGTGELNQTNPPRALSLPNAKQYPQGDFQVRLEMMTPLRIKFENRLKANLPFHVLARAMLRRLSSLYNFYGNGEPELDYVGMVRRAEAVHAIKENLSWFDWQRYSLRQEQSMLMGGIVGSVTYEGKLAEYMPLIDFCSEVHLGKQTAFGLGKFKAEILA